MQIESNKNIKEYNTLGLNVKTRFFASPTSVAELIDLFNNEEVKSLPFLVLGSGSNILFTKDFPGLVVSLENKQISIVNDDDKHIFLKVGAGVDWDFFVEYCNDRNWGGVENLSLIPGKVGASPVQNIGAYGAEAADSIYEVEYYDVESGMLNTINSKDCLFGYRNSIFKGLLKGKVVIASVVFKLEKYPHLNLEYLDVKQALENVPCPNIQEIRKAVIAIRSSKLPDWHKIGNCGSFFKNPVVDSKKAYELKDKYPQLKLYPESEDKFKLPAAWLIEQCGFKGVRLGNVGVHDKQALVLLAYEGATGEELLELANKIRAAVSSRFGIDIEPEVNII